MISGEGVCTVQPSGGIRHGLRECRPLTTRIQQKVHEGTVRESFRRPQLVPRREAVCQGANKSSRMAVSRDSIPHNRICRVCEASGPRSPHTMRENAHHHAVSTRLEISLLVSGAGLPRWLTRKPRSCGAFCCTATASFVGCPEGQLHLC